MGEHRLDMTADAAMAELLAVMGGLPEGVGVSIEELAEERGMTGETMRKKIHQLWRMGKIEVSFRTGTDMIGRPQRIPVYRLK